MTTIFSTRPGVVTVLPEDGPTGLIMAIGGRGSDLAVPGRGSYFNMRSIVTGISIEQQDDLQIQKSLNARNYAFVFGRGVGNAQINGIAFADNCDEGRKPNKLESLYRNFDLYGNEVPTWSPPANGIESICKYFDATRVASSGQVYDMVLGAAAASRFKIMVHAMTMSLTQREHRLAEFSIACKVFQ